VLFDQHIESARSKEMDREDLWKSLAVR
jgi:hypothetical protein